MDRLQIVGLEVSAQIGVHAWERQVRQRLSIDLDFETDAVRAAASDDLADAMDYGAVARDVVAFVGTTQFRLIETLAEHIARRLLSSFRIAKLTVRVHKPGAVPGARDTSVEIQRTRAN